MTSDEAAAVPSNAAIITRLSPTRALGEQLADDARVGLTADPKAALVVLGFTVVWLTASHAQSTLARYTASDVATTSRDQAEGFHR